MKLLYISLLVSFFGSLSAGILPSDFSFRAPTDQRVSFVKQFKEYEEEKNFSEHQTIVKDEVAELSPKQGCHEKNNEQELTLFEKCRKFIIELFALFSSKHE